MSFLRSLAACFAETLETAAEEEVAKELDTTVGGLGREILCSRPLFPIGGAKPKRRDQKHTYEGNPIEMRDFA